MSAKIGLPPCQVCGGQSVARNLCSTHYKRWYRHGDVAQTRPDDWGSRERHSLYSSWSWMKRYGSRVEIWDDFWRFVSDVGERPSANYVLRRRIVSEPFGPDNFYWLLTTPGKTNAKKARDYRKVYPLRVKNTELKKRFGITIEQYNEMLERQNGVCAICQQEDTLIDKRGKKRSLSVDHCHKTKKIRGLLCTSCNRGLGKFRDSPELLQRAIAYLNTG